MVNVLGFHKPGDYDQTDIDNLADAVDSAVGSNGLPIFHVGLTYLDTIVRGLNSIVDLTSTNSDSTGVGTGASLALPNSTAFVVTLRSGLAGRSARGRVYLPGLGTSNMFDTNTVSTTYAAAAVSYITTIQAAASAFSWDLAILSRFTAGAMRPSGVYYKVTDIVARNRLVDTQRGRLPPGH